jgi:hypothetical protein
MIDAQESVRALARTARRAGNVPLLTWDESWAAADGRGVTLGLIDGPLLESHPDIVDAEVSVKSFMDASAPRRSSCAHTMHAVTTLVGQGRAGRCGRLAGVSLDKGGMSPTKATRQTAPGRSMLYREI